MFAYISGSPVVFMEVFGVERSRFGYCFALTAAALLAGATANRMLINRFSSRTLLLWGARLSAGAGALIALLVGLHVGGLAGVIAPMMLYMFGMGLLQPNATALAMEPHARTAGAVSSVMGGAQTIGGALAGVAVGAFYDHTAVSMAATVAVLSALALLSTRGDGRRETARETAEAAR
jgi:DHA1 family bicyclomycin/chloramphenicol resistance-like MFS transporter